ncbi:hypothetical protein [Streptomyces sp. NPDC051776]|uniref:hypothetical protein n=1 Tax=Streptomyces sp. NPDC051776 TaxID=3155414 RepID=UPI0034428CC7
MSDLYIDGAMLKRVRRNLAHIGETLEKPARAIERVDTKAMGAAELERRMDSFGDEWSYGIGQLRKFSKGSVEALDQIEKAFKDLDKNLAAELSKAAKKK